MEIRTLDISLLHLMRAIYQAEFISTFWRLVYSLKPGNLFYCDETIAPNQALPPRKTAGKQADGMSPSQRRRAGMVQFTLRVVVFRFHYSVFSTYNFGNLNFFISMNLYRWLQIESWSRCSLVAVR